MSWERIEGHRAIIRSLSAAWRRGRLGHAYLFVGPPGVGKATLAREFARALLCERPGTELQACGRCDGCVLVDAGTHPDLALLARPDDRLEIPIERIRDLIAQLALRPARGTRKVAIVDDADDLNDQSANAFLKTLEEPPPGSVLILIGGASPDRQFATIVSRCQVISFAPLPPEAVRRVLQTRGASHERLDHLVRLSGGSIGLALALDQSELWRFRGELIDFLAADPMPVAAFGQRWLEFLEEAGKDASSRRRRALLSLHLLIATLHDALRLALHVPPLTIDPHDGTRLAPLTRRLDPDQLAHWTQRAIDAAVQIERKIQLDLILEALLDSMERR